MNSMAKSGEKRERDNEMDEGISISIPVPETVTLTIAGKTVRVEGTRGAIERELWYPGLHILVEQNSEGDGNDVVIIKSESSRKKIKAIAGTFKSHIKNMIVGVEDGFFYKLVAVHQHFPMQITLTKGGDVVSLSNFLGERRPRIAKVIEGAKVAIKGKEIIVSGINKEVVGQTAAGIEQMTRIKGFDTRVFQDGIYLVEKGVGTGTGTGTGIGT